MMNPLVPIGPRVTIGIQTLGGADACRAWTLYGEAGRDCEAAGGVLRGDMGFGPTTANGLNVVRDCAREGEQDVAGPGRPYRRSIVMDI